MKLASSCIARAAVIGAIMVPGVAANADPTCESQAYTTTLDFDSGFGANLSTSMADQVRVNALPQPLPYLWVANSERGTIVRIDTTTGQVLGEYHSAPELREKNPSRTTVDVFGNVWAGNRAEEGSDLGSEAKGSVVKIGLVMGGTRVDAAGTPDAQGYYLAPPFDYCTCVDRDGDGLIKTSRGLGEENTLPWPDITDARGGWPEDLGSGDCPVDVGPALVEDAEDECILVYQRTNGEKIRHVSVDADNNVWVGTKENDREFDLLNGTTGAILGSFALDEGRLRRSRRRQRRALVIHRRRPAHDPPL